MSKAPNVKTLEEWAGKLEEALAFIEAKDPAHAAYVMKRVVKAIRDGAKALKAAKP